MDAMDGYDSKAEGARSPDADAARPAHLGFVAHEIRNPLSTALWTAEMLARMAPSDRGGPRGEKLSAMCLRAVTRVRQLVEDHLLCERLDVGGLPMRIEAVGAQEALAAVLEKRPEETTTVDADPTVGVEADRALLERALDALIAVAGSGGTPVEITARANDREVSFLVGGHPADVAALADPVKGAPTDPTGRALAVPLARRVASALRGTLAVQGERWSLTIPRARGYTPPPREPRAPVTR